MGSLLPSAGCYGVRLQATPATIPDIAAAAREPANTMLRLEPKQQRSHAAPAAPGARRGSQNGSGASLSVS
jgi:hypothetical protein